MDARLLRHPIEPNIKLQPAKPKDVVDKGRYQRLVGRLIYISHTRPDIAFAISMVSQFMHSPSLEHLDAVNRILRYLKGSPQKRTTLQSQWTPISRSIYQCRLGWKCNGPKVNIKLSYFCWRKPG